MFVRSSQDGRHDGRQYVAPAVCHRPPRTGTTCVCANLESAVGMIIGFIYGMGRHGLRRTAGRGLRCGKQYLLTGAGTVNIFRYGAGVNGIMRTLGQYMAASGATFG